MCRYKAVFLVFVVPFILIGCKDTIFEPPKDMNVNKNKNLNRKKKSKNSIIGKTTQEIEKFDPNANIEISESRVNISNPITGSLQAYGPILEKHFKAQVNYAVRLFRAEHGRFPKDYEEFMKVVVKQGQIRLPVLPGNWKYSYDEDAHELKVIRHLDNKVVQKEVEQEEKNEEASKVKKNPAANFVPGLRGVQGTN